jgi:hypothetical protein
MTGGFNSSLSTIRLRVRDNSHSADKHDAGVLIHGNADTRTGQVRRGSRAPACDFFAPLNVFFSDSAFTFSRTPVSRAAGGCLLPVLPIGKEGKR